MSGHESMLVGMSQCESAGVVGEVSFGMSGHESVLVGVNRCESVLVVDGVSFGMSGHESVCEWWVGYHSV